MEMSVYDFAGVVGFLAYLGAYTALQLGYWRGDGFAYSVWNIIAASLVLVSLLDNFNLAAALINASWVMIGLAGLYIRHRSRRFLNN